MHHYALRNLKTGEILSILASTRATDDSGEVTSSRRIVEIEGVLLVGCYARQPLFVTGDLDLAACLLLTGYGNEVHNDIRLGSSFDVGSVDIDVVSFPDMRVISLANVSEEVQAHVDRHRATDSSPT